MQISFQRLTHKTLSRNVSNSPLKFIDLQTHMVRQATRQTTLHRRPNSQPPLVKPSSATKPRLTKPRLSLYRPCAPGMNLMTCPDFTSAQPRGPATMPRYYCRDTPRHACPLCDRVQIVGPRYTAVADSSSSSRGSASEASVEIAGRVPQRYRGIAGNDLRYSRLVLKRGQGLRVGLGPAKKDLGLDIPCCGVM
jgi:hypothetical protein